MNLSRRDFGKVALTALPLTALAKSKMIDSRIHGVEIGAQSYSFRDMSLDAAIDAMKTIGLGECELFQGHVEPRGQNLHEWRMATPLDFFTGIRKKFDQAGIQLLAYNLSFNDGFSDEEIDRGFQMARALGVDLITASSTLTAVKRVAPVAEKYKIRVAMHGHDNTKDPNQFATPESFAAAMALTPLFWVNLDIGHFTAAGYDPVAYIQEHHDRIAVLHIKDRKKDHGANLPLGEGETPIKAVLQLLKSKKYPIPANIEYEYGKPGMDTVAEVRKCFEYCKRALA
ncbi:MAG: sugar phosphate isomerase/epimerase family protein [Bryobacteraceae bacterium]|jgi:sugar phosphate isomerase/epimerase